MWTMGGAMKARQNPSVWMFTGFMAIRPLCGIVHFSHTGTSALIVEATPAKPGHRLHWLDTLDSPVVVDRCGNWRVVKNEK